MPKPYPPVSYTNYLQVKSLLNLQNKRSSELGTEAHDEMLFIIVHQTYELWFKQILTELDSVLKIFGETKVSEEAMGVAVSRLQRIIEIQKLLVNQVTVMETLTPLDFLDFREYLHPASGFQSTQNRLIENKLGLPPGQRTQFNSLPYHAFVSEEERAHLIASEGEPTLFDLVNDWLERTPFLHIPSGEFDFWALYQKTIKNVFDDDRTLIRTHKLLSDEEKEKGLNDINASEETFTALFDEVKFEELRSQGAFRLSYKAIHAALLIQLYRDQPVLQLPFQLLSSLLDIDELMTMWRYRHALMAHRMLGRKVGTGGSSGSHYLRTATEKHRIFSDFFNLATFLIPRSRLPVLSDDTKRTLGFHYSAN